MDNNLFQVNDLGVITVDTSQIQEQITQNYINALGEDLNTQSGTPQGQLIINDTTLLTEAQAQLLDICNSFSVYTATGQALDVTGGFFGYIRKTNVATVVQATLTGSQGTTISQGSIASDGTYNYILQESVVIPESGNITATFQNETPGAIPCLAGTLTQIITTITGWDSITNNVNGIVGYDIESSKKAIEIADQFDFVYASVGLIPTEWKQYNDQSISDLEKLILSSKKVVCIGEIGLDYYWEKEEKIKTIQKDMLIKQIELANKYNLPLSLHIRDAYQDAYDILKSHICNQKGILHCYSEAT